ncbi:PH domain-containing protein [Nocardia sp. NBC_01329]|uniref:PH domain-containing protein n=1 Tax=Nocardia sp. NBC_01329 TaxID=2903594 RepID=UPI002E118B3E|nr:PH domain-containing protein [Nocardia sp. NBC_01329]
MSPDSSPRSPILLADPSWRLSPRAKTLWTVQIALSWLVVFAVLLGWVVFDPERRAWQAVAAVVVVVVAVLSTIVIPRWRFRVHRWEVTDEAVYSRSGWLTQESRVAPISRVQTVDTERGPLERMLDLSTVTVTTASSAGAVHISLLDRAVAEQTVTRLTEIAARHRGDAT